MKSKIYITIISIFCTSLVNAQNLSDIARWSYQDPAGTARTLGVGSAMGAMGGDYSVIHINPAGVADYRISEFTVTPSLKFNKAKGYFKSDISASTETKKTSMGIDNIAFVLANNPASNWTSSNFAMGFSRQLDQSRNFTISGKIPGSITTYFAEKANGIAPEDLDDFIAYPAYYTGAIFDADKDNFYETDFASPNQVVSRSQSVNQKGYINELTMGWAGEYENKLNVGLSLGVPFYNYEEIKSYSELDPMDEVSLFEKLTYDEILNTTGVGINLKGGFVYKILNRVRIGGAFHSPTWARFSDNYNSALNYTYNDGNSNSFDYTSQDGTFEYKITTPWKFIGSLGTTFKAGDLVGFIDGDVEFVDYTNASYNGTAFSDSPGEQEYTNEVNIDIQKKFGAAANFRIGSELGYKNLRIRAGFGLERTPFVADDFYNNKYSFGLGYREDTFFFDLGFRFTKASEGYNPYIVSDAGLDPLAIIESNKIRAAATFGFKF
jgi:hypothetical protein